MPICANASQRDSSPSVRRYDSPGRVISDSGYAVNQTEAVRTAARGRGVLNGFRHITLLPE